MRAWAFRVIQFALILLPPGLVPCRGVQEGPALAQGGLQSAAAYSARKGGYSLLVLRGGEVLWESGQDGPPEAQAHKIFSGTKGFWCLLALAAEEDGILKLSDRAADSLPAWAEDARKSRIVIRQLLDFTSGLDPAFRLHGDDIGDRNTIAIERAAVADPGRAFIYGPCSLQVFHEILKRRLAAREETPTAYLERRVLAPLGLGPQRYVADGSGNPLLAAGFKLSARQWAEMGLVILRGGAPVVHRDLRGELHRGTRVNPAFCLGFWNNRAAKRARSRTLDVEELLEEDWTKQDWRDICLCRSAPVDLIASIGSGGQRLYVVPSLDLVVVRQGKDGGFIDADFLDLLLSGKAEAVGAGAAVLDHGSSGAAQAANATGGR